MTTQGQIQGSSSYANDEVRFPSYEILEKARKRWRGVLIQSNSLSKFPCGLWCTKFRLISPVKLLFWSMLF